MQHLIFYYRDSWEVCFKLMRRYRHSASNFFSLKSGDGDLHKKPNATVPNAIQSQETQLINYLSCHPIFVSAYQLLPSRDLERR